MKPSTSRAELAHPNQADWHSNLESFCNPVELGDAIAEVELRD
jgi:hypothetical protein